MRQNADNCCTNFRTRYRVPEAERCDDFRYVPVKQLLGLIKDIKIDLFL